MLDDLTSPSVKREFERWEIVLAGLVMPAGLILRLRLAAGAYLNPDEGFHAILAEGSWRDTLVNSLRTTHPPLLIVITHVALLFGRSELVVRMVPILAGSLFPLLLGLWLRKIAGKIAGMAALILLTLSPNLIDLSAQLRSYTLALLLLSASLLALEKALDENRWQWMAIYSLVLWLCILADYSMAWFVGGAGVYCLLRLRGSSRAAQAAWAGGQLVAAAIYWALVTIQVGNFRGAARREAVSGWLSGGFPQPGGMLTFPFVNTVKPFAYLMASVPAGVLALALFGVALFCLWTGRTALNRVIAKPLALLLTVPFLLNIVGAYAQLAPYGRSRQTLVIGLFGACGVAIFVQMLPRRGAIAVLWGALALTPLWLAKADPDGQNISVDRAQKSLMVECLAYMHKTITPGTLIFADENTLRELSYYEGAISSDLARAAFTLKTAVGAPPEDLSPSAASV